MTFYMGEPKVLEFKYTDEVCKLKGNLYCICLMSNVLN